MSGVILTDTLEVLMDKNKTEHQYNQSDIIVEIESKMQKVVTAIYMVSDLIKRSDPIRQNIRDLSVKTLSVVSNIAILSPSRARKSITDAQNYIQQLINLLQVSVSVGFVSDMNFKLITDTLYFIKDDLNKKYSQVESNTIQSRNFHNRSIQEFTLPENLFDKDISKNNSSRKEHKSNGQNNTGTIMSNTQKKTQTIPNSINENKSHKPKRREENVLAVVREKGEVSVSQVAEEFPEVSEKTIQRILVKLVDMGQLNKTGEKRWSRYTIAQ